MVPCKEGGGPLNNLLSGGDTSIHSIKLSVEMEPSLEKHMPVTNGGAIDWYR